MRQLCVCRDIEHLGSLESTQEARVALGCASCNSYASFALSKLPSAQYLDIRTLTHELIVKYQTVISDVNSRLEEKGSRQSEPGKIWQNSLPRSSANSTKKTKKVLALNKKKERGDTKFCKRCNNKDDNTNNNTNNNNRARWDGRSCCHEFLTACTWMYSHSSSKSQCTFLFARALVSTNIASTLLANSSATSSWTWRIWLENKPCFLQWKLTRLYAVERKALHFHYDSHHHQQSQWFPHTHWNWSNWITIIYVAKCNLGQVKIEPMLVAGCVCGVSG